MSEANESDAVSEADVDADSVPLLSVVKGDPTAEELAALVTVVGSLGAGGSAPGPRPESQWAAYWRGVKAPLGPGPDSWRHSASPRG